MRDNQSQNVRVIIVQDYVPAYRIPFFRNLYLLGKSDSIDYLILTSQDPGLLEKYPFPLQHFPNRQLKIRRNSYLHRGTKRLEDAEAVVLEQALHNPNLLRYLDKKKSPGQKVLFWGHGGYWTKKISKPQSALMWHYIQKVDHFLAYTEEGAIKLIERDFPLSKITILRNSIDTKAIYAEIDVTTASSHEAWKQKMGLNTGHLACFIGRFDKAKSLDFLTESLIKIRKQVPDFQFIFYGEGEELPTIQRLCKKYSWIMYGGVAESIDKAHLSLAGAIVLNPGRVGLLAVDSIAMKTPLVTRDVAFLHAPEFDYLMDPQAIRVSRPDVESYVKEAVALLMDKAGQAAMRLALEALQPRYSIEKMAENFHAGVMSVL